MAKLPPSPDGASPDDFGPYLRPQRSYTPLLVVAAVILLSGGVAWWLYDKFGERGLSVRGAGTLVVLPDAEAGAWALMLDGSLLRVTPESAERLHLKTGPCEEIHGALIGEELELEDVDCPPGVTLQKRFGERLRRMGLKFAYWSEGLESKGETLEPSLATPEVVAALVDPRVAVPQLVPLYAPLFPATLASARRSGKLPPPLVVHVKRDDLQIRRLTKDELAQFLARDTFVLAGSAVKGGWLVRTVVVDPAAAAPLERLLIAPDEEPWRELLAMATVRVRRTTPLPAAPSLPDLPSDGGPPATTPAEPAR